MAEAPRGRWRTLPLVGEGIVVRVGDRCLLDIAELPIEPGGPTVVLGPNGAGKTLLLRVLHGVLRPDQGRVTAAGRPLDAEARAAQAMVFQRPVLLRRSVLGHVLFAMRARGIRGRRARARAERLILRAGLGARAGQPARALSGGEQQRLALVAGLALAPELLFLDEPTANLDPASTAAFEALVQEAAAGGAKVVLVTHDIGQARRLAAEVVFLYRGRVVERAPAERFFAAPESPHARAYLEGRILL